MPSEREQKKKKKEEQRKRTSTLWQWQPLNNKLQGPFHPSQNAWLNYPLILTGVTYRKMTGCLKTEHRNKSRVSVVLFAVIICECYFLQAFVCLFLPSFGVFIRVHLHSAAILHQCPLTRFKGDSHILWEESNSPLFPIIIPHSF